MSANNYILVYQVKDKYYIWDNLMAEESGEDKPLSIKNATKVCDNLEEAIDWANANDSTEYGYQINNLRRPKDGFLERIEENGH